MMSQYQKYQGTISSNRRKRTERNREYVIGKMTPCVDCGFFHPAAMDWHHIDSSTKVRGGVSQLVRGAQSIEKLQEEIDKCVCLCSNCHRIRHSGA
jgi:hypothetical protein